jgi:hypothetical protein
VQQATCSSVYCRRTSHTTFSNAVEAGVLEQRGGRLAKRKYLEVFSQGKEGFPTPMRDLPVLYCA